MNYLLFLQGIRDEAPSIINYLFVLISEVILYLGPVIPIILFLCVDKKKGSLLGFNLIVSVAFNSILKLVCCVYRPWVAWPEVHLAKEAVGSATGYSFPSGHTTTATAVYGTIAVWMKKKKGIVILMIVMILLTALSRNYLGAHTFKDVAVAIGETVILMLIINKGSVYLQKHPEKDIWILVIGLIICVLAGIYFLTKSYPLDYNENGELLVNPVLMMKDGFSDIGMLSAWLISWFVERRFINFSVDGTKKEKIIRGVVGVIIFAICFFGLFGQFKYFMDVRIASFLKRFLSIITVIIGYSFYIKKQQLKKL